MKASRGVSQACHPKQTEEDPFLWTLIRPVNVFFLLPQPEYNENLEDLLSQNCQFSLYTTETQKYKKKEKSNSGSSILQVSCQETLMMVTDETGARQQTGLTVCVSLRGLSKQMSSFIEPVN